MMRRRNGTSRLADGLSLGPQISVAYLVALANHVGRTAIQSQLSDPASRARCTNSDVHWRYLQTKHWVLNAAFRWRLFCSTSKTASLPRLRWKRTNDRRPKPSATHQQMMKRFP